jgi:hypothetical protein
MQYRHYLIFSWGEIEITEPIGFDSFSSRLEQKSDGFARDVYFGAENFDLEFRREVYGEPTDTPIQLPNGKIVNYLTHGFDFLLQEYNTNGFEAEVFYRLDNFVLGQLMFTGAETDQVQYFKCKVVQDFQRAKYKRNAKVKSNVFSTTDIEGNPITPPTTDNVLLKAVPVFQKSEWSAPSTTFQFGSNGDATSSFGFINNVVESEIRSTLSFITGKSGIQDFALIEANDDLVNGTLEISCNINVTHSLTTGKTRLYWGVKDVLTNVPTDYTLLYESPEAGVYNINQSFTINNVNIARGQSLVFFANSAWDNLLFPTQINVVSGSVKFSATSIGIDSVASGVKIIDLLKSKINHIGTLPLISPDFASGGKYANQHAFNGKMIRQISTDFTNSMEDVYKSVCDELNYDYLIKENIIELKHYRDFHPNTEVGVFEIVPNEGYKEVFNDRYLVNTIDYKFAKYEQDRQERGTIDVVHGETQWKLPNKMVENELSREVKHIRDGFLIESIRRRNNSTNSTTSLTNDDDLILIDTLPIAPNSKGGFSAKVSYQTNGNTLKIANRVPNQTDYFYRWDLLGFTVGASFNILTGNNVGNYTVTAIEATVLTLQGNPTNINYNGVSISRFEFDLNDVQFVSRTTEGLQSISGVANGSRLLNLKYTPKRNLNEFREYLGTCLFYNPNKNIRNTYFKVNGNLVSKFQDEPEAIAETSDLNTSEALIKPTLINLEVVAPFDDVVNLIQNGANGYIRVIDNTGNVVRGYAKSIDHRWATNVMALELEPKNDDGIIDVTELKVYSYQINGEFVMLYNNKASLLLNPTNYKKLSINGILYDNLINFVETLENEVL